jgi:hypothetical protein
MVGPRFFWFRHDVTRDPDRAGRPAWAFQGLGATLWLPALARPARRRAMLRRYSIHIFSAGEPIPDDVSVPPFAEKHHRIREEQQPDESDSSETAVSDDEATGRSTRDRKGIA